MRAHRLTASLLSISLAYSLCGCDNPFFQMASDLSSETVLTNESDDRVADIQSLIEEMRDCWTQYGNDQLMQNNSEKILTLFDEVSEAYFQAELEYYADWNDEAKTQRYNDLYEKYYVASELLSWVFTNGAYKSVYFDLFEPYADEVNKNYYLAYTLTKIKALSKTQSAEYGEKLDDYYDTAYRTDHYEDDEIAESNVTCAQLYLDCLEDYDCEKYLYDVYQRDYTAEQVSAMYDTIVQEFCPLMDSCFDLMISDSRYERMETTDFVVDDNPFATIHRYAGKLGDSVKTSADKLWDEKRYVLAEGDDCYDGGYTIGFPSIPNATIYLCTMGDYYDLLSAIHEFGHYHADRDDTTHVYCQQSCIDVAEIQSQGMELLFTQCYDDIYGKNAPFMENVTLYNMLESVVSGFAVGKFEYQVMKQHDRMSAEEVAALFDDIMGECGLEYELYEISHLFEQPGYYISYGVSALASLQIYAALQESHETAYALYDKISKVETNDKDCMLQRTLSECGFSNIFDADALDDLVAMMSDIFENQAA